MRKVAISLILLLSASLEWGQAVPQMRTRMLTKLTNTEIEQYLKRNDVIFIPVGTVEPHSEIPLDAEYVGPLAYAIKLAEEADGKVKALSDSMLAKIRATGAPPFNLSRAIHRKEHLDEIESVLAN